MQSMVASLNDRYTEFLPPSQVLSHPLIHAQKSGGLPKIQRGRTHIKSSKQQPLLLIAIDVLALQFRKALRRPIPREREYLEQQYTGIGLQLGRHSRSEIPSNTSSLCVALALCCLQRGYFRLSGEVTMHKIPANLARSVAESAQQSRREPLFGPILPI